MSRQIIMFFPKSSIAKLKITVRDMSVMDLSRSVRHHVRYNTLKHVFPQKNKKKT